LPEVTRFDASPDIGFIHMQIQIGRAPALLGMEVDIAILTNRAASFTDASAVVDL